MQKWLLSKMDLITAEFLKGEGYGAVYEAQFLAYLECLLVASGKDPNILWDAYRAEAKDGCKPRCFAHRLTNRQDLVDALQGLQRKFAVPRRRRSAPKTSGGDDILDLFEQ